MQVVCTAWRALPRRRGCRAPSRELPGAAAPGRTLPHWRPDRRGPPGRGSRPRAAGRLADGRGL